MQRLRLSKLMLTPPSVAMAYARRVRVLPIVRQTVMIHFALRLVSTVWTAHAMTVAQTPSLMSVHLVLIARTAGIKEDVTTPTMTFVRQVALRTQIAGIRVCPVAPLPFAVVMVAVISVGVRAPKCVQGLFVRTILLSSTLGRSAQLAMDKSSDFGVWRRISKPSVEAIQAPEATDGALVAIWIPQATAQRLARI